MELAAPSLECLWDARITGMGKETWPAWEGSFGSSDGHPFWLEARQNVSVDESRHGCFGAGEGGDGW